jgi:hypothetical protein
LLFINQKNSSSNIFGLVGMQTDDTLMLRDDQFAELEEKELKKTKLMFKNREMLIIFISIKFNDEMISIISKNGTSRNNKDCTSENDKNSYSLSLTQSKQFDQIRLVNMTFSVDLTSSRGQIRKMVTSKDQYVAQRARRAYIATMTQSEVSFDLFLTAQITNSKEEDAKRLNRRLQ